MNPEILRASVFHTPGNPFLEERRFVAIDDGALAIEDGRIVACGDYSEVAAAHPNTSVRDWRGGFILPGFVDTHVHFPQIRIIGGLGYSLLDWLEQLALPEEARMADTSYAEKIAGEFVNAALRHGTTTALAFGSHFPAATAALFQAAQRSGLRIFSGLVLSDRLLRPELHQTPDTAYQDSRALIGAFHGRGRSGYAVTPRFALSASEPMLEVCQTLLKEGPTLRFTTHINENDREIGEVARLFPWAADYLEVYEKFGLIGRASVLAHNVHVSDSQLRRLAAQRASIAHCPCSNAALGSGVFPLQRHLKQGVHVALGTDVGAGTGMGMPKEALQVYLQQRVAADPMILTPPQMLYLATRAGAEALGMEGETGDFTAGKSADLVYLRPCHSDVLNGVLERTDTPESKLGALLTLGGASLIREVRIEGSVAFHDA